MDVFGNYRFQVRSYECGSDGRATLPTICNYLQEVASLHAEALSFSRTDFSSAGENISWVLTRLKVKMNRYPRWNEKVEIVTFPRGGRKIVAWRDFTVRTSDGEILGLATSEWMIIDLATRRIVSIPDAVFEVSDALNEAVLGLDPFTPRLRFPAEVAPDGRCAFVAQHSAIDLNGHVNNVHYIEWMLEPCFAKGPSAACPGEMEIVFRSETFAGEKVVVEVGTDWAKGRTYHRVASEGGRDHIVAWTRTEAAG